MTIHSPIVRPLVDELGQDIEPAKSTNFAIEKVQLYPAFFVRIRNIVYQSIYSREPPPWETQCFSHWSETNYTDYVGSVNWPYTLTVRQYSAFSQGSSLLSRGKKQKRIILKTKKYEAVFSNVSGSVCLTA